MTELVEQQRIQPLRQFQIWLLDPAATTLHEYADLQGHEHPKLVVAASSLLVAALSLPHQGPYTPKTYPKYSRDKRHEFEPFRILLSGSDAEVLRDRAELNGQTISPYASRLVVGELTSYHLKDKPARSKMRAYLGVKLDRG